MGADVRHRSHKLGILMIGIILSLAACGGGSDSSVATGPAGADDSGPQSLEDVQFDSPIGDFLGFSFNANDDMEEQFAEMEREAGRLTAECMRQKGFEYTPVDRSSFVGFGGPGNDLPYFSDEWVDKYGFGITTQRFPQSSVGDLVGYPDEDFGSIGDDFVDPNAEYVESLSEGEREAYQEALIGMAPDFDPEGPDENFMFEPTGCEPESFQEVFESGPGGNMQGFFEAFGNELEAMEERAMSDPEVVEFNDAVTACVSDAGMLWIDQEELYQRFESRLNALQPNAFRGGDPFEAAGVNADDMSEREIEEFFRDMNRLDPENLGELAKLQAEELALARVVIDCGGGPLNEMVVLGEVRKKYEQDFLDRNADALEEFKAE